MGRKPASVLGVVLVLLVAGVLWRSAFSRSSVESVLVGNAQATVIRTQTAWNRSLLVGAIALTSVGLGLVGALITVGRSPDSPLTRSRAGGVGVATATAIIVAALATGAIVATGEDSPRQTASRGTLSDSDFRTTTGFMTAMEAADLACTETRPAGVARPVVDAVVCSVPWNADIRDGHDDVIVTLWRSSADRDRWLRREVEDDTPTVVGSTWAAICQFRSTCALMAHRLRSAEE